MYEHYSRSEEKINPVFYLFFQGRGGDLPCILGDLEETGEKAGASSGGRKQGKKPIMYRNPYNLRMEINFCNNSVRKCTEKCYGNFPKGVLYYGCDGGKRTSDKFNYRK